jgi:hypothetical protein
VAKDEEKTQERLLNKINQLEQKISDMVKLEMESRNWPEKSPICTKILIPIMNLEPMLIDSKAC